MTFLEFLAGYWWIILSIGGFLSWFLTKIFD